MWEFVKTILSWLLDSLLFVGRTLLEWTVSFLQVFFKAWLALLDQHPWYYLSLLVAVVGLFLLLRWWWQRIEWDIDRWWKSPFALCVFLYVLLTLACGAYLSFVGDPLARPSLSTNGKNPAWHSFVNSMTNKPATTSPEPKTPPEGNAVR